MMKTVGDDDSQSEMNIFRFHNCAPAGDLLVAWLVVFTGEPSRRV